MVLSHLLPLALIVVPVAWGIYGYVQSRSVKKPLSISPSPTSPWPLIINSAVLYALAFNLIFFIQELFLALGKRWLGLKAILYHNNHNWEGTHQMERLAQGYGALAIFIVGTIFLLVARSMKSSAHWMQLFFLWIAFQGFAQSMPQFITAEMAPDTDTGQAFTYLGLGVTTGYIICIAGIILMLYICSCFSRYFLQLAPSVDYTNHPGKRSHYLFKLVLIASIIGVILIIPFRIMPWRQIMAPIMVTLISVPMVFAHAWRVQHTQPVNNDVNKKVFALPVVLLVLVLLVFQVVLAKGVEM